MDCGLGKLHELHTSRRACLTAVYSIYATGLISAPKLTQIADLKNVPISPNRKFKAELSVEIEHELIYAYYAIVVHVGLKELLVYVLLCQLRWHTVLLRVWRD